MHIIRLSRGPGNEANENVHCKSKLCLYELVCTEDKLRCSAFDTCMYTAPPCSDIVECASSELNQCHPQATCANTDGSFTCTCNEGYAGDGRICEGKNFKLTSVNLAL